MRKEPFEKRCRHGEASIRIGKTTMRANRRRLKRNPLRRAPSIQSLSGRTQKYFRQFR
ncbi:hypothetical protein BSIN_2125 [Burkholderia singularis]|uniref:Uncharacterized protein n=1 Tax=Burkholderia singularis TaxID=1503053 RepID=A0A238H0T1_9BURK|nr:hypothetical protein BSIN_2125 [Burkholderia singularis]